MDVFREYFPTSKVVEVRVTPSALLHRFVSRKVQNGIDHARSWRHDQGERFSTLRERYGPEYRGNEDNYKKFIEWRCCFYREPFRETRSTPHVNVVNSDMFEGPLQL